MQSNRTLPIVKKAKVILNNSIVPISDFNVGDKGQMSIIFSIEGQRKELQDDGVEWFITTIKIKKAEKL